MDVRIRMTELADNVSELIKSSIGVNNPELIVYFWGLLQTVPEPSLYPPQLQEIAERLWRQRDILSKAMAFVSDEIILVPANTVYSLVKLNVPAVMKSIEKFKDKPDPEMASDFLYLLDMFSAAHRVACDRKLSSYWDNDYVSFMLIVYSLLVIPEWSELLADELTVRFDMSHLSPFMDDVDDHIKQYYDMYIAQAVRYLRGDDKESLLDKFRTRQAELRLSYESIRDAKEKQSE